MPIVKLRAGKYMVPVSIESEGKNLAIQFPYNKVLLSEIKAMKGARWQGFDGENPRKLWLISNCERNKFQLAYLMGRDPYARYDAPLKEVKTNRDVCRSYQVELISHGLTRKRCIIAAEMGTGKTLAAIEIIELSGYLDWVWVGPRSAIAAVMLEFDKWQAKVRPRFMTYDRLRKEIQENTFVVPDGIVFDECSKAKSPTAQRSQAAAIAVDLMREKNPDCYCILMSGAPAPKSPVDWWHQCLTEDAWVLTASGPKQVQELINKNISVKVNDELYSSRSGFFFTGERETVTLETEEGYSIEATPDHRIYTFPGKWVEIGKLNIGDKLYFSNYSDGNWLGFGGFGDGYVLGLLFGDGQIYNKSGKTYGQLQFFEEDEHLLQDIVKYLPEYSTGKTFPVRLQSKHLNHLIREFGFTKDKIINSLFESHVSSECMRGFLSGFFDADGTVSKNTLRVQLGQTDKVRILTIQRMLSYFGIQSRIQKRKGSKSVINDRVINSNEINYVLHIVNDEAVKFNQRIGFHHKAKSRRLTAKINNRHRVLPQCWATVKGISSGSRKKVYDITVPGINSFSANGLLLHNCEIAQPGFLREGDINKFKYRLALIKEKQSITGGVYPELVTWLDNPRKCKHCGKLKEEHAQHVAKITKELLAEAKESGITVHDKKQAEIDAALTRTFEDHPWEESTDEVSLLYKRMQGLVIVKFKKDCCDLPERQFRVIKVEPTESVKRAAELIISGSARTIQALTLLRELSDGFQYKDEESGTQTCPRCNGLKEVLEWYDPEAEEGETLSPEAIQSGRCRQRPEKCQHCEGRGEVSAYTRTAKEVACPKEKLLVDLLDEHEPIGRFVVYAGFEASVDRCVRTALRYEWEVLRVDGRGWAYFVKHEESTAKDLVDTVKLTPTDMLRRFQDKSTFGDKNICFVGQPGAAGMGLTLTASPSVFFYSNTFNGEDRIQAMDRIHRLGMDVNLGATVIDVVHLPIDQFILDNLQRKIDLQALSMGQLRDASAEAEASRMNNMERYNDRE